MFLGILILTIFMISGCDVGNAIKGVEDVSKSLKESEDSSGGSLGDKIMEMLPVKIKEIIIGQRVRPPVRDIGSISEDYCVDSDGNNIYIKGHVSGMYDDDPFLNYDYCKSSTSVGEWTCNNRRIPVEVSRLCSSGYVCDNGKCVEGIPSNGTSCTDSDGGINYFVKGHVYGVNNTEPYNSYDIWDWCVVTGYLHEGYCENGISRESYKHCRDFGSNYTCNDGRCV